MPIKPIGLFSNATAGKDSLFLILSEIFGDYGLSAKRFALADLLKSELSEFVRDKYKLSIFTKDPKEKSLLRPLMVEHGRIQRQLTNGTYWTGFLTPFVKESLSKGEIPIICDIRYSIYERDELSWLKDEIQGYLVHIDRILPNGDLVPPANKDEKENGQKLELKRDFYLRWPTTDNIERRKGYVLVQLDKLIKEITKNE